LKLLLDSGAILYLEQTGIKKVLLLAEPTWFSPAIHHSDDAQYSFIIASEMYDRPDQPSRYHSPCWEFVSRNAISCTQGKDVFLANTFNKLYHYLRDCRGMQHAWGRLKTCTIFLLENPIG
jgi:hypothetical protein